MKNEFWTKFASRAKIDRGFSRSPTTPYGPSQMSHWLGLMKQIKLKRLARFAGSILMSQSDLIFIVLFNRWAVCFVLNWMYVCKYLHPHILGTMSLLFFEILSQKCVFLDKESLSLSLVCFFRRRCRPVISPIVI